MENEGHDVLLNVKKVCFECMYVCE